MCAYVPPELAWMTVRHVVNHTRGAAAAVGKTSLPIADRGIGRARPACVVGRHSWDQTRTTRRPRERVRTGADGPCAHAPTRVESRRRVDTAIRAGARNAGLPGAKARAEPEGDVAESERADPEPQRDDAEPDAKSERYEAQDFLCPSLALWYWSYALSALRRIQSRYACRSRSVCDESAPRPWSPLPALPELLPVVESAEPEVPEEPPLDVSASREDMAWAEAVRRWTSTSCLRGFECLETIPRWQEEVLTRRRGEAP